MHAHIQIADTKSFILRGLSRNVCPNFIEIIEIIERQLQVLSKSLPNPMQVPFFAYSTERTYNGPETDLERR